MVKQGSIVPIANRQTKKAAVCGEEVAMQQKEKVSLHEVSKFLCPFSWKIAKTRVLFLEPSFGSVPGFAGREPGDSLEITIDGDFFTCEVGNAWFLLWKNMCSRSNGRRCDE